MTGFSYGVPTGYSASRPTNSPICWSDPKTYDNESRECKGCGFSSSCRAEIIKDKSKQTLGTEEYYRKYAIPPTTTPSFVPLRVPQSVAPTVVPQQQQQLPNYAAAFRQAISQQYPSQPQQQVQIPGYPPQPHYGDYGWLQDPLHHALASVPTPMRPQMPGESFVERAAKNAGLAMVEAFFMQGVLTVRQLVLPPKSFRAAREIPPQESVTFLPMPVVNK